MEPTSKENKKAQRTQIFILVVSIASVLVALLIGFGIIRPIYTPSESEPDTIMDLSVGIDKSHDDTKLTSIKEAAKDSTAQTEENQIPKVEYNQIRKGMTLTLRGVSFDSAKSTIKPESYPVLDEAAKILKDNPTIHVEIQGHTDYMGSYEYNQNLSKARATAVVNYFIMNHNIDANRLVAQGYGETRPIADNRSESGRELNRRIEFVVIGE